MAENNTLKILQAYSEIMNRINFARQLGTDTYGGTRDIYNALGYPQEIKSVDYWNRYTRHDIAKAIIDRPVKASWKGHIDIVDTVSDDKSPFETKWDLLFETLKLKSAFIRADKLTGLGRYSIILLGLDDISKYEHFKMPVNKGRKPKLLYVRPISEKNAQIAQFDENPASERFGLPELYTIESAVGNKSSSIVVHHSRVVHLVEDLGESEVYGTPRLQAVYNRLIDLEKLIGGDAEMFWRGARPGYVGEVDSDYQMTPEARDDLQLQIKEFEDNLRRVLVNEGVKYSALAQQIADPIPHVEVNMQMISAVTGIPKRILTGSERGELSSAQDKQEWITYVTSRREEQNEPMIIRPFIDKCVEIGVLPEPANPYMVVWDKVFSLSDMEKVEMGEKRAKSLRDYTTNIIAQDIVPIDYFAEHFLAFDKLQVELLMEKVNEQALAESIVSIEEREIIDEPEIPEKEE